MDIETGKTSIEQDYIVFKNTYNEKITLVAQGEQLRCALREDGDVSMHASFTRFTREEVKTVLPYLEAYVNSGTLELQETEDLASELATMQEAGIAMAANIVDQGGRIEGIEGDLAQAVSHIKDLEKLLREWKKYGQPSFDAKSPDELIYLTEQLIGEDQ